MFYVAFLVVYFTALVSVLASVALRDVREWDAAHERQES